MYFSSVHMSSRHFNIYDLIVIMTTTEREWLTKIAWLWIKLICILYKTFFQLDNMFFKLFFQIVSFFPFFWSSSQYHHVTLPLYFSVSIKLILWEFWELGGKLYMKKKVEQLIEVDRSFSNKAIYLALWDLNTYCYLYCL
jgi:hypothetical protein